MKKLRRRKFAFNIGIKEYLPPVTFKHDLVSFTILDNFFPIQYAVGGGKREGVWKMSSPIQIPSKLYFKTPCAIVRAKNETQTPTTPRWESP